MKLFNVVVLLVLSLLLMGAKQEKLSMHKEINVLERDEDIYCLAHNLYFETRGEPIKGRIAVLYVVINRVLDERWPDNICEVVWQKVWIHKYKKYVSQFSWTTDGKSDIPRNKKEWYQSLKIAKAWKDNKLKNTIGSATHYHSVFVAPWWRVKYSYVKLIGNHMFYQ